MFCLLHLFFDKLVVEIKATSLQELHLQTNYFRCTNYPVDFMINLVNLV
jgi:hypothetical protein